LGRPLESPPRRRSQARRDRFLSEAGAASRAPALALSGSGRSVESACPSARSTRKQENSKHQSAGTAPGCSSSRTNIASRLAGSESLAFRETEWISPAGSTNASPAGQGQGATDRKGQRQDQGEHHLQAQAEERQSRRGRDEAAEADAEEGKGKKVAAALKRGEKAKARLSVKLTDLAGNRETEKLRVRL
jgi:hypothetical protein